MLRVLILIVSFLLFPSRPVAAVNTWAIYDGEGFTHISGSSKDFRRIGELKHKVRAPFIYLREGRDAWLITDASTIVAVRTIFSEPDELKARRWELEVAMLDLERKEDKIDRQSDRLDRAESSSSEERIERAARELEERERRLEEEEALLEEIEREYERDHEVWEELAEREVMKVVRSAIERGLAERLR